MNTTINIPAVWKWLIAFIIAQWLQIPGIMRALLVCMVIDYGTGIAAAFVRKEISSEAGVRGLVKKMLTLIVLLAAHIGEQAAGIEFHIEQIGAMAYLVNELVSIVENCSKAGVPIPSQLVEALLTIKKLRVKQANADELKDLMDEPKPVEATKFFPAPLETLPVADKPPDPKP